jgi:hypothetical protein
MRWEDIRKHYPDQWLMVEAIKAHSEDDRRILEQLAVLGVFPDSATALKSYALLHREAPQRELYVLHTSRTDIDITERQRFYAKPISSGVTGDKDGAA